MKKICIRGDEFNTNHHIVYGEEQTIKDGFTIFKVPEGYEDCAFEDFDENGFNVKLYNARKLNVKKQHRLSELLQNLAEWDYKGQKYIDGEYTEKEWNEIKNQRKIWREEIRKLQEELNYEKI